MLRDCAVDDLERRCGRNNRDLAVELDDLNNW